MRMRARKPAPIDLGRRTVGSTRAPLFLISFLLRIESSNGVGLRNLVDAIHEGGNPHGGFFSSARWSVR